MKSTQPNRPGQITRFDAAALADARGLLAAPASLLIEAQRSGPAIVAVGRPAGVSAHPAAAQARPVALPHSILIPGLVNAHTHLDLTHIGPRPHDPDAGFVAWIDLIRAHRHADDASIAAAVCRGIELSLAGGVVAVGDIAGAPKATPNFTPWRTLRDSSLLGVSFLEFFGIGRSWRSQPERLAAVLDRAQEELTQRRRDRGEPAIDSSPRSPRLRVSPSEVRLGLQPHAPTTVDLRLYRWAVDEAACRGLPVCTHLAETGEERLFVASAEGPQRDFLERLGLWDDSILDHLGRGLSPVAHLASVLESAPLLVAHVNDADDAALETLARTRTTVAYCPRASDYFAAPRHFGPHRYRDMLGAGINVCLGTDSIVNLPPEAAEPTTGGISTLHEMRYLYARDGTDPQTLLGMATVNGARALGLDPDRFLFNTGSILAGLVAVELHDSSDPLAGMLRPGMIPQVLLHARAVES